MPIYERNAIRTADDIRTVSDSAGYHFFDADAMRSFSSRILSGVWAPDGYETEAGRRYLFVTSERYETDPRRYTVRMLTLGSVRDDRPAVDISDVGGFQAYATAREARKAAEEAHNAMRYGA